MANLRTLLIVDDCGADRKIYRRYLAKDPHQSYAISEATSAEAGLLSYRQAPSDVVLLDFRLPDMNGLEFLDHLTQDRAVPLPVIMLTGQGDEAIAVQAIKRGAQDYLIKGNLNSDSLQLAVRSVLRQSTLHLRLNQTIERQRLIATTALQIRRSLDVEEILRTATVEVQQLLQCDRVVVYQFAPDQSGTIVAESVVPGWSKTLGLKITDTYFQQQQRYCEGDECTLQSVAKADLSPCYRDLLQQFEVKAHLVVPIVLSDRTTSWGLLIAHQCGSERDWMPDEVDLLRQLSVQLAIAIQQAELLLQTQTALKKEKEVNVFRSNIITTVSHEYRTPLTTILAAASTLKQHHDRLSLEKREQFLGLIEQKARHMARMVDDMLLVQTLNLSQGQFQPTPMDLLQFCADLIEEQQSATDDRHQLSFRITGNPKGFWGDRRLLRQILNPLMSNAIKYSPAGGKVELHLKVEPSQVQFLIHDEGIGIPDDDRAALFDAFSRGSNIETLPGTGLGLAIAKACAELHKGTIAIVPEQKQGSTFKVTLPLRS
jgi:signal transduction histidine kinase